MTQAAPATTLKAWSHNRKGIQNLGQKNYYPAHQEFMRALETDPLNPYVQMNLGLTFEANEEFAKAEKAYRGVLLLEKENSELRFQALFNLAGALARQQKIDEALAMYQAALEIQPESLEVKTNIELLWQGGGGGGQGNNKDEQDKEQQGNNQQKREQSLNQPQPDQQKQQPKPFNSQDLSKEDVKRILDEIKNQEQSIRANEYEKGPKESAKGKDW